MLYLTAMHIYCICVGQSQQTAGTSHMSHQAGQDVVHADQQTSMLRSLIHHICK